MPSVVLTPTFSIISMKEGTDGMVPNIFTTYFFGMWWFGERILWVKGPELENNNKPDVE